MRWSFSSLPAALLLSPLSLARRLTLSAFFFPQRTDATKHTDVVRPPAVSPSPCRTLETSPITSPTSPRCLDPRLLFPRHCRSPEPRRRRPPRSPRRRISSRVTSPLFFFTLCFSIVGSISQGAGQNSYPNRYQLIAACHVSQSTPPVNPSQFDLNFEFQTSVLVLKLVNCLENNLLGQILQI
jgi:hypothetical protein